MIELLMTLSVLAIALTAMVGVFTAGFFAMRQSSQVGTAGALADAQMETYRGMTSRDIGIDLAAGTISALDSTYKNDAACANTSTSTTCAANGVGSTETGPTGATPDACSSINTWYPNTLPCKPSRTVSSATTPASQDGRNYRVDTYVVALAATSIGVAQRARKQVTVVVRDSSQLSHVLARESSIFDCSTGVTPNSSDC
jgi:type II secretory pathway pseudopilin PulG